MAGEKAFREPAARRMIGSAGSELEWMAARSRKRRPDRYAGVMRGWRALNTRPVRRALAVGFFALGVWLVWRQLQTLSWPDFRHALATTAPWQLGASIALTAGSYACLAGTEWLALRVLGHDLGYRDAAMVAAPAYALTNSAGFSPATGTAFRLQLYGQRGLNAKAAAAVALTAGAAVTASGPVTAGLAMLLDPGRVSAAARAPAVGAVVLGVVLIAPAALWFVAFTRRAPRWLGGRRRTQLSWRARAAGLACGVGDWLFSCAALFVLLPHPTPGLLPGYLVAYVAGSLLSAATGVPGGIGVFEAIVLTLATRFSQVHETAAALLLYRGIYSLGPLAIWSAVWLVRRRGRVTRLARKPYGGR